MSNAIMDSKLTLGTIIALVPLVVAFFVIDSRYLHADMGAQMIQEIRVEQKKASKVLGDKLDFNYSRMRIDLAEIRVERYQDKLDGLILIPAGERQLHQQQEILIIERTITKYQDIIDRERENMENIDE